jgi:hypothetical protein
VADWRRTKPVIHPSTHPSMYSVARKKEDPVHTDRTNDDGTVPGRDVIVNRVKKKHHGRRNTIKRCKTLGVPVGRYRIHNQLAP